MRVRVTPRVVMSLGIGAVTVALVFLVPVTVGTTWAAVAAGWPEIPLATFGLLAGLWIAGLLANSVALTAGLPGLPLRRALALSLTGSAVANVLPLGGAAGVGLNYAMTRSWGFSRKSFAAYTMVTNVWDVAAKLTVVAAASLLVLRNGRSAALPQLATTALVALVALPAVGVLLLHPISAEALGRGLDRCAATAGRLIRRSVHPRLQTRLPELARTTGGLVRRGWPRFAAGSASYVLLQATLLWACLQAAGVDLDLVPLAAAYGVDRLLTLVPFTPGGAGVVEAGTAAALTALGAAPEAAVAGVLLYRGFTYLAEIPVGGVLTLIWSVHQRPGGPLVSRQSVSTGEAPR